MSFEVLPDALAKDEIRKISFTYTILACLGRASTKPLSGCSPAIRRAKKLDEAMLLVGTCTNPGHEDKGRN